jgi:hypothetical protein
MLIQPTLLLSLAVLVGVQLAPDIGLTAPRAAKLAPGRSWHRAVYPLLFEATLPVIHQFCIEIHEH